jgi:hypothetical protein
MSTVQPAVNPVSGSNVNPQFRHTFTDRLCIAEVAGFDLSQPRCNPGFCYFVSKRHHPLSAIIHSMKGERSSSSR